MLVSNSFKTFASGSEFVPDMTKLGIIRRAASSKYSSMNCESAGT